MVNHNNLILGHQPIYHHYQTKTVHNVKKYKLTLKQKMNNGLIYLDHRIPINAFVSNYKWLTETELNEHNDLLLNRILKLNNINSESQITCLSYRDDDLIKN